MSILIVKLYTNTQMHFASVDEHMRTFGYPAPDPTLDSKIVARLCTCLSLTLSVGRVRSAFCVVLWKNACLFSYMYLQKKINGQATKSLWDVENVEFLFELF